MRSEHSNSNGSAFCLRWCSEPIAISIDLRIIAFTVGDYFYVLNCIGAVPRASPRIFSFLVISFLLRISSNGATSSKFYLTHFHDLGFCIHSIMVIG